MVLTELLSTFRDLAYNHTQIEGFYTGLVEEHNDALIQYPALRLSFPYQALASQDDDVLRYTINLTLLVNDIKEDVGNDISGPSVYEINTNAAIQQDELNEINSDLVDENLLRERAISIMAQYIQGLRDVEEGVEYFVIEDGWNIQSLERFGNDKVTGCRVALNISVGNDYKCQSITNLNNSVWIDSTVNHLNFADYTCPECPELPTECVDLLPALTTSQLNDCILPTYDFADPVIQAATTGQQQTDMTSWLCLSDFTNDYSMNFDASNDYITNGNYPAIDFTNASTFTMSGWVRSTDWSQVRMIMGKRNASGIGYNLFSQAGKLRAVLRGGVTSNAIIIDSTVLPSDNVWYHIALSYDGSGTGAGTKMYIDGVDVTSVTQSGLATTISNTNDFHIGASNAAFRWGGDIDIVRVWDIVLTPAEVADEYNAGVPKTAIQKTSLVLENAMGDNAIFDGTNWLFPNPHLVGGGQSVNMVLGSRTTNTP